MRSRLRILGLAAALLLIAPNSFAAADKWTGVRLNSMLVVGDASDAQVRRTAQEFAAIRGALETLLPGKIQNPTVGTTVVLFKNDAAYKPFKPPSDPKSPGVSGVFQASTDIDYVSLNAEVDLPPGIIREYVHQILRDLTGSATLPLWFTEGLSDYYSTLEINPRDFTITLGRPIDEYVTRLSKEQLLPMEELFGVNRDSAEYANKDKLSLFRAESWALVRRLMQNREASKQFGEFVGTSGSGKRAVENFQDIFEVDLLSMQKELERAAHAQASSSPSTQRVTAKTDFSKELQPVAVSDAESEFYLGDLLFHMNRLGEAEDWFKKSIAADPKLAAPEASLGILRMKQKKYGEAVDFLQKAVTLDSTSYLAHYNYAFLLNQQMQDTGELSADKFTTIESELKKAIELSPHFYQAYELLAYFNLSQNEYIDETLQLVRKAHAEAPGRDNLTLMLAQLVLHEKNFEEGRALLTPLANSSSTDPNVKRSAENLLEEAGSMENVIRDRQRREQDASRSQVVEMIVGGEPPVIVKPDPLGNGPKTGLAVIEEIGSSRPKVQGEKVTGLLTLIDCRNGMTLTVKTDKGEVALHSDDPGRIQFTSYTAAVSTDIQCGPTKAPGISVAITYKPTAAGGPYLGEPLLVEFLDF